MKKLCEFFGRDISWYGLVKTLCFIAGLSTVFLILGYGAGALGQVLYAPWFRYLLGGIVILLGIHQMEPHQSETTPKTKEHPTEEG